MGAYSLNFGSSNDTLGPVNIDSLMESTEIEACYEESSLDAAARVIAETTSNWNAIIEACAIDEYQFLEENGTEMVYEGAKLDGFINKAKEFFMNIWKKIQEIFKKAVAQFNSWTQSDKDFIKKYEKDLNTASNKGLGDKEVKFFDYVFYANGADMSKAITIDPSQYSAATLAGLVDEIASDSKVSFGKITDGASAEEWKELNKKLSESDTKTDILDSMRAEIVGKEGKIEANEFVKAIKEDLQGSDSKDDVKLSSVLGKCISFLGISDKIKTSLNKMLNVNKKSIDNAIKALDTIKKSLSKTNEGGREEANQIAGAQHSVATTVIELLKSQKSLYVTANGVTLDCLKACSRQSKAMCVAALSYKAPKNESGMFQEESEGSLLGRVKLV